MTKRIFIASMLSLPSLCYGQLDFFISSQKSGLQEGPKSITYEGGNLTIGHQDGSWVLSPCPHPSDGRILPSLGCALGTTGYLAQGDLDGDDIRDDGSFWSLAQAPIPSIVTDPFNRDGIRVEGAPPSEFIRPQILPVNEGSVVIWYNVLTTEQRQYEVARYSYFQDFLPTPRGRADHDLTVTTGSYLFSVPWIHDPIQRQTIGVNMISMPESYPGLEQSPLKWGFRFTNDENWNDDNEMEFDPRLFNTLTWEGIVPGTNLFLNLDQIRLWILETPSDDPFEVPESIFDPNVTFPPAGGTVLFTDPRETEYLMPALFYEPGDTGRLYLRMERNHPTSTIAADRSTRVWMADLRFIDTYAGFASLNGGFPVGTTAEERDPYYDYDGDGMINLNEFALNSDPADPADVADVTPIVVDGGLVELTLVKRPNTGTSLTYGVEYSSDMEIWTLIEEDDPTWDIITDSDTEYVVRSKEPLPAPIAFLRARIVMNK